ncbi:ornithine--oxo-acid transaminase [Alicyclobacillus acidocaldarius]|uniref:Ornithine aminotransferase n=1 Tax=Alicyclobacillus acidocaldarius subsp. acidocaldarius (strain ATCC 27009 / DSM 446 / BCRC 14685 / JCM 5260 / KCTC 1825 / NBRC 15652 / NCIMB 11725 / NRRL B-14509 / 104-IA) TaxID=521098 RepID=C8WRH6_ALIAD|nr:ornithine--oxo-acid transaminase [Alicyclobacillus acidocaldarius]ACV57381.1 ornithine aminotransferase [Alicyclobacillus acidocaldarius subsp. acidocaldarius DSM 446]
MATQVTSREALRLEEQYGAKNYHPLPVVLVKGEGVWVWDAEGKRYLDMLSAYSALNQGHRHPRIIQALKDQADAITLTSRAFYNDKLGQLYERIARLTHKDMVLPMNTGAEAVETAIKAVRRYAYDVKGVPNDKAEIIVAEHNFHGRTTTIISFSSDPEYRRGFGPLTPGFRIIPYGDIEALKQAITENTAAFLVEPIQGEAGIIVPPEGYLREAYELCRDRGVLFVADEIQTGLGRTGHMFACDWEGVVPDVYILGKALGGGVFPVSAVAANRDILGVFEPGSHGSTFGGNPLGAAVAIAALDVIVEEKLPEKSRALGEKFLEWLRDLKHPVIKEVRGRGLFIGVELHEKARPYCERLKEAGLLCKETHENTIRFAPPLVITEDELAWAFEQIRSVFAEEAR